MKRHTQTRWLAGLTAVTVSSLAFLPMAAFADTRYEVNDALHNPIVKQSLVGAGIGAATGFLTGHHHREGHAVLRGAGIGALTGAGTGLVSSSQTMRRHPLVKST